MLSIMCNVHQGGSFLSNLQQPLKPLLTQTLSQASLHDTPRNFTTTFSGRCSRMVKDMPSIQAP